ncbi:MAG TPA: DedA family protein [Candidatus Competibacteraceae bacterium]|nr:DedA family protein [Candidatus Competibacteraceae bacterium]
MVVGFFAVQGLLNFDALIVIVRIGEVLGDSISDELGRRLGHPALTRYGSRFGLNNAHIENAEAFFKRHGGKAVFLGRFVGFAQALVPFLVGSSQMPYRQFITYNALGSVLWVPVVVVGEAHG